MKRIVFGICLGILGTIFLFAILWHLVSSPLKTEVLSNNLEGKICALANNFESPNLILAGDSRAQFQLIPEIFDQQLGKHSMNIAINYGDVITLYNAIQKYPAFFSKCGMLLISIGISEVNQGSLEYSYLSLASFVNFSLLDHLMIYHNHLPELWTMYKTVFRIYRMREWHMKKFNCEDFFSPGFDLKGTKGFAGYDKKWDLKLIENYASKNQWYSEMKMTGPRWDQFISVINKLQNLGYPVVLIQSPFPPSWYRNPATKMPREYESEFGKKISLGLNKMRNVYFIDLFSNPNPILHDSNFMDACHLNTSGAKILSEIIAVKADSILRLNQIGTKPNLR